MKATESVDQIFRSIKTELGNQHVHIWKVKFDEEGNYQNLKSILSNDESAASERFRFNKDRNRSIVSRAVLRLILGRYLNSAPKSVHLQYSKHGKPLSATHFSFNVSHSGCFVVYAFTLNRLIGIDIECIRRDLADFQIVERYFSSDEIETFQAVPSKDKTQTFFNCWTRKEAFIKAVGEGLSYPLKDFDVTLKPNDFPRVLSVCGDQKEASCWTLRNLDIEDGYIGAIAVRGNNLNFKLFSEEI